MSVAVTRSVRAAPVWRPRSIAARESVGPGRLGPELKRKFGGVYIANEGFSLDTANQAIAAGEADAVAFGRLVIANPDLPQRFALGAALNTPDPSSFYGSGPRGYTDYPALDQEQLAVA